MALQSRVGNGPSGGLATCEHARHGVARGISARHHLLGDAWTADVEHLERAIDGFNTLGRTTTLCEVVLFEMAGDRHLHCNVTHQHPTKTARGWIGPGHVRSGWVHNRRFGDATQAEMIRHIREMVFAARL